MKNYPQIYDYKPLAGNIGDSVTTALLDCLLFMLKSDIIII